ncbi:MAG: arylsulfatase [Bryobacterales bacterium]
MLTRRDFLASTAAAVPLAAQQPKPNIIFILADDLGYGDLGCYGQTRISTPNIDRIAREGMRFTQAYAGSTVCAPSRCCLMTGLHTGHARVRGNAAANGPRPPLAPEDATVAEMMQKAGYKTGAFGKWALGEAHTSGRPNLKGFDQFYGYYNQTHAHSYYPTHLWENERYTLIRENRGSQRSGYSHDLIAQKALDWVDDAAGSPFFLYLAFTTPHADNELGADTGDGMPVPDYGEYADKPWPTTEKGFAAMITRMDRDIGRLLDLLKKKGVDGDTLILFSSDNGPHQEGGHDPKFFESQGGLRGIKRDMYEGGVRVPALARWPGRVKPGVVSKQVWAFWDFFPTACDLAGIAPPAGLDGVSIVPALDGKSLAERPPLYWEFHERNNTAMAARDGDWKAVRKSPKAPIELYDLSQDVAERHDVAARNPQVVAKMETSALHSALRLRRISAAERRTVIRKATEFIPSP